MSGFVKDLAKLLPEATEAQICFFLIFPSSNDERPNESYKHLVNNEVRSNMTWFQNKKSYRDIIFAFSNDKVSHHNPYTPNSGFELKERGKKLQSLRLRKGFRKTMRLPLSKLVHNSSRNENAAQQKIHCD